MTDQRPCPSCGHEEEHEPVEPEVAANNSQMTVMCSNCGNTYAKDTPDHE